jgi:hypothetical protein
MQSASVLLFLRGGNLSQTLRVFSPGLLYFWGLPPPTLQPSGSSLGAPCPAPLAPPWGPHCLPLAEPSFICKVPMCSSFSEEGTFLRPSGSSPLVYCICETGRWSIPKKPWDERVCHICDTKKVEDEKHFFLDCSSYTHIRSHFQNICHTTNLFNLLTQQKYGDLGKLLLMFFEHINKILKNNK